MSGTECERPWWVGEDPINASPLCLLFTSAQVCMEKKVDHRRRANSTGRKDIMLLVGEEERRSWSRDLEMGTAVACGYTDAGGVIR